MPWPDTSHALLSWRWSSSLRFLLLDVSACLRLLLILRIVSLGLCGGMRTNCCDFGTSCEKIYPPIICCESINRLFSPMFGLMCSDSGLLCVFFLQIFKFDIVVIWNRIQNFFQKTKSFCQKSSESGFRLQQYQISKIQKKNTQMFRISSQKPSVFEIWSRIQNFCVFFFFQIFKFEFTVISKTVFRTFFKKQKVFVKKVLNPATDYNNIKFQKKKSTQSCHRHQTNQFIQWGHDFFDSSHQIMSSNDPATSLIARDQPMWCWLRDIQTA